jgi:hypothetical protein
MLDFAARNMTPQGAEKRIAQARIIILVHQKMPWHQYGAQRAIRPI